MNFILKFIANIITKIKKKTKKQPLVKEKDEIPIDFFFKIQIST